jgi:hypothetical protein
VYISWNIGYVQQGLYWTYESYLAVYNLAKAKFAFASSSRIFGYLP